MMKRIMIAALVAAMAITATACSGEKKDDIKQVLAATEEVKQTVEAFGIAKTTEIKNINLSFPATVEEVHIREGQKVKKGDSLITLDISEYMSLLKNKQIELKAIQGEINILLASKNGTGPDIAKLQSDFRNAEDLYNKAIKELADKEALLKAGFISQYDLDEFKKTFDAKKKAVEDARLGINSLKNNKSIEVDQKITRSSQLESEIALMKDKLGKSYLKDNIIVSDVENGVVYDIGYKQGDMISDDMKVLGIMDLDSLIIEAEVAEEFIKDVKLGSEVTILPTADRSKEFKGKVARISDKAVQKNGETNILVEITMDEKNDFIMPEYNVDVKIKI